MQVPTAGKKQVPSASTVQTPLSRTEKSESKRRRKNKESAPPAASPITDKVPDPPKPFEQDGGAVKRRKRYQKLKWGRASTTCKHNVFTHFPKDPNCEICRKSKAMKTRCSRKDLDAVKPDSLPKPTAFGQFISADHAIFNENHQSRQHDTVALIIQDTLEASR